MADVSSRGRFVWYDLMTTNPKAAISFYTKVLGWGTEDWSTPGGPPYTMWTVNKAPMGGVMQLPDAVSGVPPHWIAYVSVPNVDDTAKQVTSLGGKVLRAPSDIPTVGRFAVITDPQGAVSAIFTPEPKAESPGVSEPQLGNFAWHELMTSDYASALEFYKKIFGWEKGEAHDIGSHGIYQIYRGNGKDLGGMFNTSPEMGAQPSWMLYARVENADRAVERVTKNGGKVANGPMDVPGGGRIAQCIDPQGAMFAVMAPANAK